MVKSALLLPALVALLASASAAQQANNTTRAQANTNTQILNDAQINSRLPWLVTVAHQINIQELQRSFEQRGIKMREIDNFKPINITTGIVIDRAGHVLTRLVNLNPEARESSIGTIRVFTATGAPLTARFIGLDGPTGFCLLAIENLSVEPARFTEQSKLSSGAPVTLLNVNFKRKIFKVQNAEQNLSKSPLMTTARELQPHQGQIAEVQNKVLFRVNFTDAAPDSYQNIGVLVNSKNELVGIPENMRNSSIQAFSAYEARRAAQRILTRGGNVPRAWLGVGGRDLATLPAEKLAQLAPVAAKGVYIENIVPDSPAAQAGLQVEDLILTINGEEVLSLEQLSSFIPLQPAGETVEFDIWRDRQLQRVKVTLSERGYSSIYLPDKVKREAQKFFLEQELKTIQQSLAAFRKQYEELKSQPSEDKQAQLSKLIQQMRQMLRRKQAISVILGMQNRNVFVEGRADQNWLGISVVDLPSANMPLEIDQHRQVQPRPCGVRVTKVFSASVAEQAGIKDDDIIVQISSYMVTNRNTFIKILSLLQHANLDVCETRIQRNGETLQLELRFTAPATSELPTE
ncbi:MAG: PDZ domain-containing protein [Acidobacteriota bacterium]